MNPRFFPPLSKLARPLGCSLLAALSLLLLAAASAVGAQDSHRATAHATHRVFHRRRAERRALGQRRASHRTDGSGQRNQRSAGHRRGDRRVRHGHSPAHPTVPATSISPTTTSSSAAPAELIAALPAALESSTVAIAEQSPVLEKPPAVEEPVSAPANMEPPSIGGPVVEGAILSASPGAWSGEPVSLEYQWQDCNASGEECVNVSEATSPTYNLAESDVGTTMRVSVTASNRAGSSQAWSPPTRPVLPPAPMNVVSPSIVGKAMEGETLKASSGMWWHSPTAYTYQWELCGGRGESCTAIGGATGSAYRITASAVKHRLRVSVTASNTGGSTPASSADTSMVQAVESPPQAPINTALPAVTGKAMEGETLTASAGTWTGDPTSVAYQWQACTPLGEGCLAIPGAASSSYVLVPGIVGEAVRVLVTATNAGGSTQASSAATPAVEAVPPPPPPVVPVNTVLPVVSGTAEEGRTLSASTGTWSNSPTSFAYQWEDCNSSGAGCSAIGGATASTHALTSSDVGHTLRVVVKATNAGGTGEAASEAGAVVTASSGSGGGGGAELHPNLTATGCFEYPKVDIEGTIVGEGTERITACGYPTPENVGAEAPVSDGGNGKKCAELPAWNKATEPMGTGDTITGKLITEGLTLSASHLTLKDDCIVVDAHGGCGASNESGCPSTILYTSAANYLTLENTTVRTPNDTTEAAEVDIYNEGDGNTGVLLKKDVIEGCGGGGGCIKGGAANGKTFELLETYLFTNANVGKAEGSLDIHREDVDLDEGNITFKKSTVFNPTNEVAIVFGETNEGEPNVDEFVGEENLISGAGQEFGSGKNANAPLDPKNDIFRNNRFARCRTTPFIGGSGWGEPQECSGPYYEGGDSHGFMPKSGQERIFAPPVGASESFKVGVWEGNFWDDNRHEVREHNEEGPEL